ncbi:MAG: hypothetical protein J7K04_02035, partial [Spirochaetales bacterium]|nr:hypothetical protein [Spirochaetales bacterium]
MKSGKIKKVFTAHIFFNRFVAVLILLSFTSLITADDFSARLPGGFDKKTLELYLDRADLSNTREEWQRIAEYGLEIVTVKWEGEYLFAAGVSSGETGKPGKAGKAEPAGTSEQSADNNSSTSSFSPSDLKSSLDTIVTERFKKWLIDKFFKEKVLLNPGIIYREISRANRQYLFETEEDGSLKLDSEGDPVLKKADSIEEDTSSWNMLVRSGLNKALDSLEGMGSAWESEILNLIETDTFLKEHTGSGSGMDIEYEFSSKLTLAKKSYKNELDRIFNMEEKIFKAKREKDQFSLRKKSEKESADKVVKKLIEDTRTSLSPGLKSLEQSIETAGTPLETKGREITASKWREDFKRVFNSGMNKWKSAEKELLLNRMEWENRAGKAFTEGEKEWEKAYEGLVKARQEWQSELNSIVNKGLVLWQNKEDSLSRAIEDSKEELALSINDRTQNLSGQLDGLIDIYLKSAGMIKQAEDSINFWKEDSSSGNAAQIEAWENIRDRYARYRDEAERKIVSLYGIAVSDGLQDSGISGSDTADSKNVNKHLFSDFEGGFRIDPLLNTDGLSSGDNIFLDEYQAELIKAKTLKEYWNRQYDIALYVYNYAQDKSSDRPTEAETKKQYEQAFKVFKNSRDKYEEAVDNLKAAGRNLESIKGTLGQAQEELKAREKELEAALDEYNIKLSLLKSENGDYFRKQISGYYKNLLSAYRMEAEDTAGGTDQHGTIPKTADSIYSEYFTASRLFELDSLYSSLNDRVFELVTGKKGEDGFDSLSELKRKAENTENWQSEWKNNPENLQELLDNLDIKIDDPVFCPRFQNEFNLLYKIESTAGTGIIRSEKEALKLIESLKVEALGSRAAGLKQENYANRLNEIEVLTSESIEQWLNETGFNLAKYNAVLKAAGLEDTDTYAKLKYLADTAEGRYYLARAAMEKEVAAEAASISLKIFGDDENIQNNSWLSELAEYYKGDLIEKSAAAVITD